MTFRKISLMVTTLSAFLLTAGVALAHDDFRQRKFNQHQRIKQGLHSGELTHHEYKHLKKEQRRIRKTIRRAGHDGYISRREARQIRYMQRRASKNIRWAKHNRHKRHYGHSLRDFDRYHDGADRYRHRKKHHGHKYHGYKHQAVPYGHHKKHDRHIRYKVKSHDPGWSISFSTSSHW